MSGKKRGQGADYTDSLGLAMAYFDGPLEVTKDGVDFELLADYPNGDEVFGSDSGCLVAIDDRNELHFGSDGFGTIDPILFEVQGFPVNMERYNGGLDPEIFPRFLRRPPS